MSSILDKHRCIKSQNTSLIWLSDVSEDNIDHWYEHSVFLRVSSVFNNWDDISSLFGHVDQVATNSLREFDSVDSTFGTN